MSSYTDKTYIVFLDLPLEIQEKIDSIRKKYGSGGHEKWPSHITFKQDEDFLLTDEKIIDLASGLLKTVSPVKVRLDGPKISYFDDGSWNIYIGISDDDYLKDEIKKFSKAIEQYVDTQSPKVLGSTRWEQSDDFYSHISLKGGSIKEEGEAIFNEIKMENFNIQFPTLVVCKSVTLAKWNLDHWEKVICLDLK